MHPLYSGSHSSQIKVMGEGWQIPKKFEAVGVFSSIPKLALEVLIYRFSNVLLLFFFIA